MSYQVLARKWRPKNFKEMAGQGHVLQTLVHALESGRLHHAYLFTGTRGVGKTTIARILAKCLNCEQGVTATPCEQCDACREISEGRFIDLIEVDAASRTKVEDTRELLENVQYAPSRGRFKVYLIDEVHMLSTHSFNALLKTLEEPPPHVKFLLATTDPQKLPITILSRCLQFNLKNFLPEKIVDYLKTVLLAEQIEFEEPALWHLARAAQGSMRDALTLLDQAIAFGQGSVRDSSVQALLGTPSQMIVFRLLDAVRTHNAVELLTCAGEVAEHNANYHHLLESMLSVLHRAAVAQVLPRGIDNSNGDREHIISLARQCAPEDLQLYYQITLKSQEDLRLAPDLQMAFEMFLLRLLAFTPEGPVILRELPEPAEGSLSNEDSSPAEGSAPAADVPDTATADSEKKKLLKPAETAANPAAAEPVLRQPEAAPQQPAAQVKPPAAHESDISSSNAELDAETASYAHLQSAYEAGHEEPEPAQQALRPTAAITPQAAVQAPAPMPAPAQPAAAVLPSTPAGINPHNWREVVSQCALTGISANLIANCTPEQCSETSIELILDETQSALFNEHYLADIRAALNALFERSVQVDIRIGKPASESPAAFRQRTRQEHRQSIIDSFNNDSNVRAIVEQFSASIRQDSLTLHTEEKP